MDKIDKRALKEFMDKLEKKRRGLLEHREGEEDDFWNIAYIVFYKYKCCNISNISNISYNNYTMKI